MKLIVAGSSGYVAAEVIRQALSNPAITSVVGLGRRATPEPQNLEPTANVAKFNSVILKDFGAEYPDDVKKEFAEADACIWTIGLVPNKAMSTSLEEAGKICRDYPVRAVETISKLRQAAPESDAKKTPCRFLYISGSAAERDQTKKPLILGAYLLIRGQAETGVLKAAEASNGTVQAGISRPGLITANSGVVPVLQRGVMATFRQPHVRLSEITATLLHQAVEGVENDTLQNGDLVKIGQKILRQKK
ncbi:hypothetical protein B0J18DRAFT_293665 [Chaetomium sp. MPI-SDFR-AT-0129]|nr:hypothetical protein B0J18DRAFT_293665 [Chaetomium sp. MPI-SDFR-AT-0129]